MSKNVVLKLPTLYKKTSTGAIQFWEISAESVPAIDSTCPDLNFGVIRTKYGQVGTDSPQETTETIRSGKNAGKSNETTAVTQAIAEAQASWTGKKKKGYVEDLAHAEKGLVDDTVIKGGMLPMLAQKFSEQGDKLVYPCFGQPKFDGIRAVAIVKNGTCTLWTRTRKPILSCPHIIEAIEQLGYKNFVFDGELYAHTHKNDFEGILSAVNKDYPSDLSKKIEYHIYDTALDRQKESMETPYSERLLILKDLEKTEAFKDPLFLSETKEIRSEEEIIPYFEEKIAEGYEGAMFRNSASPYVNKRSNNLLKFKDFDDGEFKIVGIEEGKGKLEGHVATFVCVMDSGITFPVAPNMSQEFLKECFTNHGLWAGRSLLVRYQGFTKYGIPRIAKGLRFRDNEDF